MKRREFLLASASAAAAFSLPALAAPARSEWVVGQSVDLSGDNQNLGRDYFTGAKIALDQANATGGTGGRRWRHLALDDAGQPEQALANTRRLLQEGVHTLFGYTTPACVQAVLQSADLRATSLGLFAPMCGLSFAGDERRAVYLRATHAEEVVATLRQFADGRLDNFVIVHSPRMESIAARDAAMAELKRRNLPVPVLRLLREDGSNRDALASELARSQPQAAILLTDTVQAALLARQLRSKAPGIFTCMTSSVDITAFQQLLKPELAAGVVFSRVVPNPLRGTEPVVRDFGRALGKFLDEPPTAASLEGYIAARALIQIAARNGERMGDPAVQRSAGLMEIGGWKLDFRNGNRASAYADTSMLTRTGGLLG